VTVAYREFRPPPDLAHIVRCVWVREGTGEAALVLPDGCLDILVRDGRALVAGPDTGPVAAPLAPGQRVTGVRLWPGAGGAALGVPAAELRDRRVPLDDLWGHAARAIGERAGDDPVALVDGLRARLSAAAPDPRVVAAAQRLARSPATPVPALAAAVGLGERQLRRRFQDAVGYGPKTFARVARFRFALALLHAGEPPAGVAAAAGFADQAHLTRELGALAGCTPGAVARVDGLRMPRPDLSSASGVGGGLGDLRP
jgi:AraC-like DNA-binding protein